MSVKTQAHMYFDFNERQWQTMLYSGRFEYFFELFMRCTQTWKLIEREFEKHAVKAQLGKEDLLALVCLVNSDLLANGTESWWHKDKVRLLPDDVYTCELISIYLTLCQ